MNKGVKCSARFCARRRKGNSLCIGLGACKRCGELS